MSYSITTNCVTANITNADHIRSMTDEELANNNIRETYVCETDYDCEDEPYDSWNLQYQTSDGSLFYDMDSAFEYELSWLKQPCADGC